MSGHHALAKIAITLGIIAGRCVMGDPFEVPFTNASFEDGMGNGRAPTGWDLYGGSGKPQKLSIGKSDLADGAVLILEDGDPNQEVGITQQQPAKGGVTYEATVKIAAVPGKLLPYNLHLQMRFLPSNTFVQETLAPYLPGVFQTFRVVGNAPENTQTIRLYIYTHRGPTTDALIDAVCVRGGVPPAPAAPPPPPAIKAPAYTTLKALHLVTQLAANNAAACAIVHGKTKAEISGAKQIMEAIKERTGVTVPVLADSAREGWFPSPEHLILVGNRSTNRAIGTLYERYYTLLDLKYPGPGGYVVRSLHNPFADGKNVFLVGGSDGAGIGLASQALIRAVGTAAGTPGSLSLGWTMDIKLGDGIEVPENLREFETWEASDGYGSIGYFGWSSLSKRMAMYYMTGNKFHAREFVRLAFPDAQAKKEISDIDGERIENKDEPLAGAYHYNQHMTNLYWDLIEESPVFSDGERLRITNSLARQLEHNDYARKGILKSQRTPSAVGSRHGQWAAIGLYTLGRYFQKYYPEPIWDHTVLTSELAFRSLHRHAWVNGESDNLFWYSTGIAPIFTYLALTGDRVPLENGVVDQLLRGQEILLNGSEGDRQLSSASLGFLHKAAYFTQDGRWIYYRQRTRMRTDIFRLGQSYWPEPDLAPAEPADLCGKWSIMPLPRPMWQSRGSGIPFEHSILFASFRDTVGKDGDFVLLDGYNGASRNPYHTFAILDLRLGGKNLLRGYHNQVFTKADGMVEPSVAMDAGLTQSLALGDMIAASGVVPRASFANWKRTLVQRLGSYALVIDELTFREDSGNMSVDAVWETTGGRWLAENNCVLFSGGGVVVAPGWLGFDALKAECVTHPDTPDMLKYLDSIKIALLRARETGAWIEMPFTLSESVEGEIFVDTVKYVDRGTVDILLDGNVIRKEVSLYADTAASERISLGRQQLAAGSHVLRMIAVGFSPAAPDRCYAAIGGIAIKPDKAADKQTELLKYTLQSADAVSGRGSGIVHLEWTGAVKAGQKGTFFSLIAPSPETRIGQSCTRIDDTSAFLRLPDKALAVAGKSAMSEAEVALVSASQLFAIGARRLTCDSNLFSATEPVDLAWNFETGRIDIQITDETVLTLGMTPGQSVVIDGTERTPTQFALERGTHMLSHAFLRKDLQDGLRTMLATAETNAEEIRQKRGTADQKSSLEELPTLSVIPLTSIGSTITGLESISGGAGLCAISGKRATMVNLDGSNRVDVETDGAIRVAHWWDAEGLLLLGCVDEKLVAVKRDGAVSWIYTSVMDPAVFRAAKTYWFKTAPGHAGIHGLASGPFIDGREQCMLGSACTLEIVNPDGTLAKRMPVFWGPGKIMRLMQLEDDSRDLLIARWPNGTDRISVVNSRGLTVRHSFYGVPSGHTMVGGWSAQNRVDVILSDVNGDGDNEVVSATNGRWNRVTVFAADGRPLANAQFGPGASNRFRTYLRDLSVGNLRDNGKQEIVTATHESLVVCLDSDCRKLWSYRAPALPVATKIITAGKYGPGVLVACADGQIILLGPRGNALATATVPDAIHHVVVSNGIVCMTSAKSGILSLVSP